MKRWLILTAGWAFVLLGIVGLVLPVLQGILFLAIGLGILARESAWFRTRLQMLRKRFPQLAEPLDKVAVKANSVLARFGNRRSE